MTTYADFLPRLAADVPVLGPILEEHLEDNDGELLAHLLLSDIRRWCLEHVTTDPATVQQVADGLEHALGSGDEVVENALAVSFVEDLMADGAAGAAVIAMLGPGMSAMIGWFGDT
jgi:hypothetical protein